MVQQRKCYLNNLIFTTLFCQLHSFEIYEIGLTLKQKDMNKIIKFLLVIVPLCFFSCGGDGEESGIDKEPESIKVDIVALWEEISGNKESVISLAKDGTYKMIIKQGNGIYYFINGDRYEGNFKVGLPDKKGRYFYKNEK